MESIFKEGDIVKIDKKSVFYIIDDDSNPRDIEGVVQNPRTHRLLESLGTSYSVIVEWKNGRANVYRDYDLGLIKGKKNEDRRHDV
jgi:hypothetical protein